jgi:prepilin-type N-terminal cleavage/methylation domain-containing protein
MMHLAMGKSRGFTLLEVTMSAAISGIISLGLLVGFTSLERNFAATADFATNHADEMRISDYLALDLRRALSVQTAPNDTSIYVPSYYDSDGNPQAPAVDQNGNVYYGVSGSSVRFHYYLSGGTIYRQQDSLTPIPIAENVKDFVFNVTDLGKVVTTKITFNPTFVSTGPSTSAIEATAFYNVTLLRNSRTDAAISVY